jgi:membrane protease YdiL (CAAX protease family)
MSDMKFLERALDGTNQVWRYVLVIVGGFLGGQMLGMIPLMIVMGAKTIVEGGAEGLNASNAADLTGLGISHNLGLFLMLLPSVASLFLIIFLIRWLHGRRFTETVNGRGKVRWERVASGAIVWGIVGLISFGLGYWMNPGDFIFQFDAKKFGVLVVISLVMLPLQTTSEELLFRGYLAQGVAAWTRRRWMAIVVPAVVFGLMHCVNPEVKAFGFWEMMANYILLGLVFGLVAVMDDGIELAIGMHAVNNILACLTATHPAMALQTDALFVVEPGDAMDSFMEMLVTSILVVSYFASKYRWDFKILGKRIESNIDFGRNK